MTPDYVTVFEISKQSTDWSFVLPGAGCLLIGVIIILGKRRFKWSSPNWAFAIFACGFGILWLCLTGAAVVQSGSQELGAYQKRDYWIVEGPVTNFKPMPYEGHQDECFSVKDQRFCYSDYEVTRAFRNSASHGGPIREGLPVRIAYWHGSILRLDIPRDAVISPAESAATLKTSEQRWQDRTEADPVQRRINFAFLVTAVCWTLWWNIQWKRVMRFWVRPPKPLWVQYCFRAFFALNFLGAVGELVQQFRAHTLARPDIVPSVEIAAAMCTFVAIMCATTLWRAERSDRKKNEKLTSVP